MPAYLTSFGKFLPGEPVPAERIEEYVGSLGNPEIRDTVVENGGIRTRHFAIDRDQRTYVSNTQMASSAITEAIERSPIGLDDLDVLAVATSAGDFAGPALANMVHGDLMQKPVEIVAANGFCASSMVALKSAYLMVRDGEQSNAAICGSELTSRQFKSSRYENGNGLTNDGDLPFDVAFLRYMLSDGAGAAVIQDRPAPEGVSYRIEWVTNTSYAHTTGPCMYVGSSGEDGEDRTWQDYETIDEAAKAGALSLRQNMKLLPRFIRTCGKEWARLINEGYFDPDRITRVAFHYSSEALRAHFRRAFAREGVTPLEERWYSNLVRVGNIGCAAIWVMLEELDRTEDLEPGNQVLCFVPESGRFGVSMMLLTVVGPDGD